ncbi:MAG: hypothetical protein KDJ88_17655 [Bauldia sp.]|nr:hypothetical protein [Bauldia sp.]
MGRPSSETLSVLAAEAESAACRLCWRLRLSVAEVDDLRQELLADLVCRLPAFDPNRGTLGAFANVVLRNRSSRIANRVMRERSATGGPILSLDATSPDGASLGETLSEGDGLDGWSGRPPANALAERRLDLCAALERLDHDDRQFCVGLSRFSVDELATRGLGSRATLYRRLHRLRLVLTAHGARAA